MSKKIISVRVVICSACRTLLAEEGCEIIMSFNGTKTSSKCCGYCECETDTTACTSKDEDLSHGLCQNCHAILLENIAKKREVLKNE